MTAGPHDGPWWSCQAQNERNSTPILERTKEKFGHHLSITIKKHQCNDKYNELHIATKKGVNDHFEYSSWQKKNHFEYSTNYSKLKMKEIVE